MPGERGFAAELEADAGLLRVAGDCHMADLEALEQALVQWREAGSRRIDLTAAGAFDIGPAWLIHASLREMKSAGNPVETAATGMPEPSKASTAVCTNAW